MSLDPAIAAEVPLFSDPDLAPCPPAAVRAAADEQRSRTELFERVYAEQIGIVWKTARAFAPTPEDQEDLVQEILLSLWEAIPRFGHQSKLSSYVYRVAYHRALNWKRASRRYQSKLHAFELNLPRLQFEEGDDRTRERLDWLYGAIQALRPVEKTVCLLYLDGLSHAEMAEILGISEANVSIRVHRCKQRLTELLQKDRDGL